MKDWTSLWLAVRQLAESKASQVPGVSYHDVVLSAKRYAKHGLVAVVAQMQSAS